MTAKMTDSDLRKAVRQKIIRKGVLDPETLVVEELGVNHGRNRIDIAVVSDKLHGYELKSDSDNLLRLPSQAKAFSAIMDKVTLVVGSAHAQPAIAIVPQWWGVKVAYQGVRGGIRISTERRAINNPSIDPFELLKLVWKDEAILLLSQKIKVDWRTKSLRKKELYQLIVENFTTEEVRGSVREILTSRIDWRSATS